MSKSKIGIVTRDTPQLITEIFPEVVAKFWFVNFANYIRLGNYWLGWMIIDTLPKLVGNVICITPTSNVHIASWGTISW